MRIHENLSNKDLAHLLKLHAATPAPADPSLLRDAMLEAAARLERTTDTAELRTLVPGQSNR